MKKLFPQIDGIVHGGDYNPEQWLDRPDILEKDVEYMKEAGINCVTLGVFSWSVLEPREGEFHFEWLHEIIDNLYKNGIHVVLATPSGARPAWLDEKYVDAMRVDIHGQREHHGIRHNHCLSSENYRNKVRIIDSKLAEEFANHPAVILWHISNEFGGECYCDLCTKRFQQYLSKKFDGDIDKLNKAWWNTFWSHNFNSFEQIEPPFANGETTSMGLNLEWKRFTSWSITDFMKQEIDVLRQYNPNIPVTTNYMKLYWGIDYHEMSKELDVVSWDSYPLYNNDFETLEETLLDNAYNHVLYRAMKPDRPFMLMESVPGLVNWTPVNKYKRPGVHKLACFQAVATGSDTVQYFQIRKGRGSAEQYHGAIIDHLGTNDTRVFKEVKEVGELLKKVKEVQGSVAKSQVAMLFDWDNRWAIDDAHCMSQATKDYEKTCIRMYMELAKLGVDPDVVSSDVDWSAYKVIVAPMLYVLHDGIGDKIRKFVAEGGQIISTYCSGYVDKNLLCHLGGFPGDGLKEVFGIISEELDSLYPTDRNYVKVPWSDAPIEVYEYAEMLRVNGATVLGTYLEDYIEGTAAITKNSYEKGNAYYIACRTKASDLAPLFKTVLEDAGVPMKELPGGVEYHVRYSDTNAYAFYLNTNKEDVTLTQVEGYDLIHDVEVSGSCVLKGHDVIVTRQTL